MKLAPGDPVISDTPMLTQPAQSSIPAIKQEPP